MLTGLKDLKALGLSAHHQHDTSLDQTGLQTLHILVLIKQLDISEHTDKIKLNTYTMYTMYTSVMSFDINGHIFYQDIWCYKHLA